MPKLLAICFMLLKRSRIHKTCLVVVLDLIGMPRLPAEAKGNPQLFLCVSELDGPFLVEVYLPREIEKGTTNAWLWQ